MRAAQLVAAAAHAHLIIVDADIQFNHVRARYAQRLLCRDADAALRLCALLCAQWELSAHSLARTLLDPLQGLMPPRAADAAHDAPAPPPAESPRAPRAAAPAAAVSLNAPRSYFSDDGIVHLFSSLLMHACLGTHVHQPMGGEFSLHAEFNAALLAPGGDASSGGGTALPAVQYNDSYCVQSQLLTRALVARRGAVVERLMRGKWHAKIGLAKILDAPAAGKSRIDLVTERMFDDVLALAAAGVRGASAEVHLIAAGATFALAADGAPSPGWVGRSRQMERGGTHLSAAAGESAAAPRAGFPGVYPDPLAQKMCVLAPPIARKEIWAALKHFLRDFLARDLSALPEECTFANEVLPVLHCACNAPRGAFRVLPAAPSDGAAAPPPVVFGAVAWARATASLLRAYRDAPPDGDARRAVVHANRLSWLLGALAFLNATVAGDWGAAHERLDEYCAAFRAAYLTDFLQERA